MKNKKIIKLIIISCLLIVTIINTSYAQNDVIVSDGFLTENNNSDCEQRLKELRDSCVNELKKSVAIESSSSSSTDKKKIFELEQEIKKIKREKNKLISDKRTLVEKNKKLKTDLDNLAKEYSYETKVMKYHDDKSYKNENISFHTKSFETFVINEASDLKFHLRDKRNNISSLSDLKKKIEGEGKELIFGTNGGMYNMKRQPQGYLVINGQEMKSLDKSNPKDGTNFYLKPNGVFFIDAEGKGAVLETDVFARKKIKPKYATQSGPMLVVDGEIHPALNPLGKSKKIRSGVGVRSDGVIIFAISNEPVNFHTFARLFKYHYECTNALFLDGTVSRMYSKYGKKQLGGDFGPMIGITKDKKDKKVVREKEIGEE